MGNPFQSISDTVSDFAGDVADAWNRPDKGLTTSRYLSYPYSLGDSSETSLTYDSNTEFNEGMMNEHADARASGANESPEPFIMFEFFRVIEQDYDEALFKEQNKLSKLNNKETTEEDSMFSNPVGKIKAIIKESIHKKELKNVVALYMTPAIAINDTMSYSQESRKLASVATDLLDSGLDKFGGEDGAVMGAQAAAAAVGGLGAGLASVIPGGALLGGAGGAGLGDALGDEIMRQMGKATNPNEYMQYKNTALRSFSFTWKMLPDSAQESSACSAIIKTFRGAAHANRKSSITLTVPDQVIVSFHGAKDIPALPLMVISSVSVTYNPNSASFFKDGNRAVEIDLSVTLNEVMPIYRDDVEIKGY